MVLKSDGVGLLFAAVPVRHHFAPPECMPFDAHEFGVFVPGGVSPPWNIGTEFIHIGPMISYRDAGWRFDILDFKFPI